MTGRHDYEQPNGQLPVERAVLVIPLRDLVLTLTYKYEI